ncbi:MAG: ParA family protein [Acidobacteriota bacterium]|nr:ParA family protein [Acidobacteriota bacterium]
MIRLVICNQKGGVAKTTSTLCIARCFAERGLKVLLVDTDSQGSLATSLGIKFTNSIYHFLVNSYRLQDCVNQVHPNIDVLCSTRQTIEVEGILTPRPGRELILKTMLEPVEKQYDAVIIDVAPSITLLQSCALMYAQQALIPLTMDPLSLQGAYAVLQTAWSLNSLFKASIKAVAILPVMVDKRLAMTDLIYQSIEAISKEQSVPILHSIRVDSTVQKATRSKTFLQDFDSKCKAVEDYRTATDELLAHLKGSLDGRQLALAETI